METRESTSTQGTVTLGDTESREIELEKSWIQIPGCLPSRSWLRTFYSNFVSTANLKELFLSLRLNLDELHSPLSWDLRSLVPLSAQTIIPFVSHCMRAECLKERQPLSFPYFFVILASHISPFSWGVKGRYQCCQCLPHLQPRRTPPPSHGDWMRGCVEVPLKLSNAMGNCHRGSGCIFIIVSDVA